MSLSVRSHIVLMLLATVVAWICWLMVLLTVHPDEVHWWGFALFYVTFFLALFGTFAILGFALRSIISARRSTVRYRTVVSLRQGFLWALALIIALALQSQRMLSVWIAGLLLIIFMLIEFTVVSSGAEHQ